MIKKIVSILIFTTLLFSLCSCSGKGADKTLTYPLESSPRTLDPQYASETGAQLVINNIFEGLVRVGPNGDILPGIAKDWVISEDGLTYIFHLKEGTEWYCPISLKKEFGEDFYNKYSQEKVTAQDFAFACQRTVSPDTGSSHAHRLFVIKNAAEIASGEADVSSLGVYADDDNTLRFSLTEKCDDFLLRLTECEFMPCNKEFFNSMGGRYGLSSKHILCNGPFYLSAWFSDSSLTIKRNKYYSGSQTVSPAGVTFSFNSDAESILKKLESATLSAAFLSPETPDAEDTITIKTINNSVLGFVFNCSDDTLYNTELRQALCYSINPQLFSGDGSGFVPESCLIGSESYRKLIGNKAQHTIYSESKAKGIWDTCINTLELSKINITILCPEDCSEPLSRQIQIWQKVMGLSIGVTVETLTGDEIASRVKKGEFQVAITGIQSDYDNAIDYLASFYGGSFFRFDSSTYDSIIDKLKLIKDQSEMANGCYTAESYLLNECVFFPLYTRSSRLVANKDVDCIYMNNSESSICFINARRYD